MKGYSAGYTGSRGGIPTSRSPKIQSFKFNLVAGETRRFDPGPVYFTSVIASLRQGEFDLWFSSDVGSELAPDLHLTPIGSPHQVWFAEMDTHVSIRCVQSGQITIWLIG